MQFYMIRSWAAIRAACHRLKLPEPVHGTHTLFSGQGTGLGVQLPGWQYPVVCDLQTGQIQFDNFQGRWGDPAQRDRFKQAYDVNAG
jgi:hypothetical protein